MEMTEAEHVDGAMKLVLVTNMTCSDSTPSAGEEVEQRVVLRSDGTASVVRYAYVKDGKLKRIQIRRPKCKPEKAQEILTKILAAIERVPADVPADVPAWEVVLELGDDAKVEARGSALSGGGDFDRISKSLRGALGIRSLYAFDGRQGFGMLAKLSGQRKAFDELFCHHLERIGEGAIARDARDLKYALCIAVLIADVIEIGLYANLRDSPFGDLILIVFMWTLVLYCVTQLLFERRVVGALKERGVLVIEGVSVSLKTDYRSFYNGLTMVVRFVLAVVLTLTAAVVTQNLEGEPAFALAQTFSVELISYLLIKAFYVAFFPYGVKILDYINAESLEATGHIGSAHDSLDYE